MFNYQLHCLLLIKSFLAYFEMIERTVLHSSARHFLGQIQRTKEEKWHLLPLLELSNGNLIQQCPLVLIVRQIFRLK